LRSADRVIPRSLAARRPAEGEPRFERLPIVLQPRAASSKGYSARPLPNRKVSPVVRATRIERNGARHNMRRLVLASTVASVIAASLFVFVGSRSAHAAATCTTLFTGITDNQNNGTIHASGSNSCTTKISKTVTVTIYLGAQNVAHASNSALPGLVAKATAIYSCKTISRYKTVVVGDPGQTVTNVSPLLGCYHGSPPKP
jgi:hypothetical protein